MKGKSIHDRLCDKLMRSVIAKMREGLEEEDIRKMTWKLTKQDKVELQNLLNTEVEDDGTAEILGHKVEAVDAQETELS